VKDVQLEAADASYRLQLAHKGVSNAGIGRVHQQRNDGGCRDQLGQHF
jgi:hypothetical protein